MTPDEVQTTLQADLGRQRPVGYCKMIGFPYLDEETDTLRIADTVLFILDKDVRAVAFRIEARTKMLSDPSPEQRTQGVWQAGSLEDAARAICAAIKPAGEAL